MDLAPATSDFSSRSSPWWSICQTKLCASARPESRAPRDQLPWES